MIFFLLIVSFVIQTIFFIPAFILKTDKFTDLAYALTFVILGSLMLGLNNIFLGKIIVFLMIFLWAARLGVYLFIRINKIKRDKRFDNIRNNFVKFGSFWLLQGVSVWVIMLSSLIYFSLDSIIINMISWIGFIVWLIGLIVESISDYQKFKFVNNSSNRGKWIDEGLWKYSRHPNYFGEILIWIGIYLFVLPSLSDINIWIGLVSPVYIIILLLFVSGIPKAEEAADKRWGDNEKYLKYKKRTSILIPFFKKHEN
ncbi:MAG: DUF1295 domain-containing protein [Candidatus Portnoybacteria bacterium]|nr:DUF1295 domain-containing protein [Candidatus Portnoybacteria bacterium]